jgi:hypothetical protein
MARKIAGQTRTPTARSCLAMTSRLSGVPEEKSKRSKGMKRRKTMRNEQIIKGTRERKKYFR